ncbi:DUF3244 domain-containing protein [Ancylomarina sp. 16SWW S1-10-2]|uniref:DUF3244 domain-containing protein n=1 Tax=Ancylomarina sp. 16SWW S1-10-2 TaxID=2499681 RepID=UPI0012AE7286|nr:DUF3244 domain-containing protein [Ancylomarina sp. 16SWW S1-10-2]MRT94876.1 DUF3244 domain-containing protein [Ancylomarina sp. 16SWW S1-10-2]
MKNLNLKLKGLALVAILVASLNSAFAGDTLRITPYLDTDYSVVSVFNTSGTNLKLKIYDKEGNVFYSEAIKAETNTQKLFDLSNLSDGNYELVLEGKNTRIEEPFIVRTKTLVVLNESMQLAENRN